MVKKKTTSKKTAVRKSAYREPTSAEDFKTAALVVSVLINLAVFIGWLALRLTNEYDTQVFHFLFSR